VYPSIEREEGRAGACNVIRVSIALFPVSRERYVGVSRFDSWTRVILACIGAPMVSRVSDSVTLKVPRISAREDLTRILRPLIESTTTLDSGPSRVACLKCTIWLRSDIYCVNVGRYVTSFLTRSWSSVGEGSKSFIVKFRKSLEVRTSGT